MLLFQQSSDVTWWVGAIMGTVGVLTFITAAIITVLSVKKNENIKILEQSLDLKDKLLKAKDAELEEANRKLDGYDALKAEYKGLVGIDITELFRFYERKVEILAQCEEKDDRIRILEKRLRAGGKHND